MDIFRQDKEIRQISAKSADMLPKEKSSKMLNTTGLFWHNRERSPESSVGGSVRPVYIGTAMTPGLK